MPSNTPFNFTYIDPVTHQRRSCSTNCSLSNDASIEYQDFVIQDATLASGIRVQISSWYGSGGGLASIEIFQRGTSRDRGDINAYAAKIYIFDQKSLYMRCNH